MPPPEDVDDEDEVATLSPIGPNPSPTLGPTPTLTLSLTRTWCERPQALALLLTSTPDTYQVEDIERKKKEKAARAKLLADSQNRSKMR